MTLPSLGNLGAKFSEMSFPHFNPFAPELPIINSPCRSMPFLPLVTSSVLMFKDNFVRQLVQSQEVFQTVPE